MAYEGIKQSHPGAPSAVGIRVRHKTTGRVGTIAPRQGRDDGVRVRFDGEAFAKPCDPQAIAYLTDPAAQLGEGRR